MTIYNAYLLKGYLSDKKAPKRIMEALDSLIGHLHAAEGKQRPASLAPTPVETESDSPDEDDDPASSAQIGLTIKSRELAQESFSQAPLSVIIAEEHTEPPSPRLTGSDVQAKKPRNFSPEARAAAAERMRAMQARKRAEKEGMESPEPSQARVTPSPAPAKPFTTVSHEKLISDHTGYAGKRDPGLPLTDEDWPDIKARLAKSPDRRAIAGDYDVDLEDLNFFIASCQRREGKSPGEAQASPSSGASGAARPRW